MTVEKAFEEAGFTVTKQSEEGNQTNYVLDIDGYQIEMSTVKFDNKGQASEYYESVKAERESGDASMIVNRSKSAGLSLEYTNGFGGDTKGMVVVVYETKTVYDLPSIPKAYLTEVENGFKNLGF